MENIESKQINCPVCNSQDYENIYKKEYRLWIKNDLLTWPAQQVICKNCGMIFTNPQPTNKTLKWFYESDMRYGEPSDFFRELQLEQLEFIYIYILQKIAKQYLILELLMEHF